MSIIGIVYYEWIVWTRDGKTYTEYNEDGSKNHLFSPDGSFIGTFETIESGGKEYFGAGWVPFTPLKANTINEYHKKVICSSARIPSHFVTVEPDERPHLRKLSKNTSTLSIIKKEAGGQVRVIMGNTDTEYFYVVGSTRAFTYTITDRAGNTRTVNNPSKVVVPIIPRPTIEIDELRDKKRKIVREFKKEKENVSKTEG